MKSDLNRWDRVSRRLSRLVVVAIVVAASLGVSLKFLPLIQRNQLAQLQVYQKEARLADLSNDVSLLRAELESYKNDPEARERMAEVVARTELRWLREDEYAFRFAEE